MNKLVVLTYAGGNMEMRVFQTPTGWTEIRYYYRDAETNQLVRDPHRPTSSYRYANDAWVEVRREVGHS